MPPAVELEAPFTTRPVGGWANRIRDLFNSLWNQIVVPTFKRGVVDFGQEALVQIVQPEGHNKIRRGAGPIAYDRPYRGSARSLVRTAPIRSEEIYDVFQQVYFGTRGDAEIVLGRLMEKIVEFNQATVADFYHQIGLPAEYAHNHWGWRDLHGVLVQYTTSGFIIDLPEPRPLSTRR
jgi:hypothetical protein